MTVGEMADKYTETCCQYFPEPVDEPTRQLMRGIRAVVRGAFLSGMLVASGRDSFDDVIRKIGGKG